MAPDDFSSVGGQVETMALTFLLESSLVSWLGIVIGTVTGILLARNVIGLLAATTPRSSSASPGSSSD